jgi:hypothetical protein
VEDWALLGPEGDGGDGMNYDELRQAHVSSTSLKTFCGGCGHAWPCPTIRLLDENEALKNNHLGEGTFTCTCNSYPHSPNCGLDARLAKVLDENAALRAWVKQADHTDVTDENGKVCLAYLGDEYECTCGRDAALGFGDAS